MQKYTVYFIAVVIILFAGSCNQPIDPIDDDSPSLYKTWVRSGYEESLTNLKTSAELDENEYGFIFHSDGKFTERKNSGWCGTPPISYGNFEGHWTKLADKRFEIIVDFWGGEVIYQMEIVDLSSEELKILYHYEN